MEDGTPKDFIETAESFADRLFKDGEHITNKVDTYYIIGYNKDTILEVEEEYNSDGSFDKCKDLTIANGGDGTVPIISANIGGLANSEKTYYIEESHTGLVSNNNVIELIENIINDKPNVYSEKISNVLPEKVNEDHWYGDELVRLKLKVECPVNLAMVDDNGNEWAYVTQEYIYNENSDNGTFYHLGEDNESKMAFLQDGKYNVKLIGTDIGVMKYTMSVLEAGKEVKRIVFDNVEITDTTILYTTTDRFNSILLDVDVNSDGVIDYQIEPSYILDENEITDYENKEYAFEKSSIVTSNTEIGIQIYADTINATKMISAEGLCDLYANKVNITDYNASTLCVNNQYVGSVQELNYSDCSAGIVELSSEIPDVLPVDAVSYDSLDMIYYTTNKITDFITGNSISIYLEKLESEENTILYSRNGNINISCSEIDFDGVIYAPNGTVTLSANNINIKGTIIAEKVIIYGNSVNFE